MKKQIKRLNLNKKTISNLSTNEMDQRAGGIRTGFCDSERRCTQSCGTLLTCGATKKVNSCHGC